MDILEMFYGPDINQGIKEFKETPEAVLLDVRTVREYREGHIPGSKNLPVHALDKVRLLTDNKEAALFVYCQSGGRSRRAVQFLRQMGYGNVKNIGGIANYIGKVVR